MCRDVKKLVDALMALVPDDPVSRALVWSKFIKRQEVLELQALLDADPFDPEAQLGLSVLSALAGALDQLKYSSTGRTLDGLVARNIILAAAIDLEDLQAKRLVTAFAKALGVSRKAIYRGGKRRAQLRQDWFKWHR